jgi:hypothetical protein
MWLKYSSFLSALTRLLGFYCSLACAGCFEMDRNQDKKIRKLKAICKNYRDKSAAGPGLPLTLIVLEGESKLATNLVIDMQ